MNIKPDKLVVNPKNPFDGDLLGRKKTCERWTQFIKQENTPFVLAVDVEWGNGKTTFLEMWQAYLENEGFKTVFFDAQKADSYVKALPALLVAIRSKIKYNKCLLAIKKISRFLRTIQLVDRVEAFIDIVVGSRGKALSKLLNPKKHVHRGENDLDYEMSIEKSKKKIKRIVEKVNSSKPNKPFVIFIDELDRCRPVFIFEVLEEVKHIFDVEGVFFVIALNKKVLSKTIESQYSKTDGNIYLEKFFDRVTTLENSRDAFIRDTVAKATIDIETKKQEFFIGVLLYISDVFNLSLRTQERMANLIDSGVNIPGENLDIILRKDPFTHCILLFLTLIHASEYELFREVVDLLNRQVANQTLRPDESIIESLDEKIKLLKQFNDVDYVTKKEIDILCMIMDIFVGALNGGGKNYDEGVEQFNPTKTSLSSSGFENEMLDFYREIRDYTDARKFFLELSKMIDLTKQWSSERDSE